MRWIKHLATAHTDAAITVILEQMGPQGYGIYWLLLEQLAVAMDASDSIPEQIHSEVKWAQILHCSTRTFRNFVEVALKLRLICAESEPELRQNCGKRYSKRLKIAVPKLLKYRDEYTKRSGQSTERIKSRIDTEQIESGIEDQAEEPSAEIGSSKSAADAKQPSLFETDFEADWPKFWYRVGKRNAFRKYCEARKVVSREKLIAAVLASGPLIMQRARAQGITPIHPATWLDQGRWDDEIDPNIACQVPRISKRDKTIADFRRAMAREMEDRVEGAGLIHGTRPN